jgi:prepilin-type N-terminal cleavage/methylation domain-containing protein
MSMKYPNKNMAPSHLAQAVHRQVHGLDIPTTPTEQSGFSLVEVLLGLAVVSGLGLGALSLASNLSNKKDVRIEQGNVQQLAEGIGSSYSSVGRFPTGLRQAAIIDNLVPVDMIQGSTSTLRNVWGSSVDLRATTINAKANAGMEIIYASVPKKGCAPFAIAASGGMFDVEIDGSSVIDAQGNIDPLLTAQRCDVSDGAEIIFTYYSGRSGLAMINPPMLCASDMSNPLCATTPPPGTPPGTPPGSPPSGGPRRGWAPAALAPPLLPVLPQHLQRHLPRQVHRLRLWCCHQAPRLRPRHRHRLPRLRHFVVHQHQWL